MNTYFISETNTTVELVSNDGGNTFVQPMAVSAETICLPSLLNRELNSIYG
jgi:hypothetical protein